jgi:hypothetical protein
MMLSWDFMLMQETGKRINMVIVGGEFSADNEIKTFIQKLLQIKNDETKYFGVAGWFS